MNFPDIANETYLSKVTARRKVGNSEVGIAVTVGDDKKIYLRTIDLDGTSTAACRISAEQAKEISNTLLLAIKKSSGDWFAI